MKFKIGLLLCAVVCMLGFSGVVNAEIQLKQLGVRPFYKPELKSVDDFRQMVKSTLPDLKKGFEMAGAADLFDGFVSQAGKPGVEEIQIKPGEKLHWMMFKSGKKVKLLKDVVWAGKKPFKAFRVNLEQSGKRYTFVIPAQCGNVALDEMTALPPAPVVKAPEPPKPAPAPAPNKSPLCHVDVSPVKLMAGKELTIDASRSNDPDGAITAVSIQVLNDKNEVVSEKKLDKPPFTHQMAMPKAGDYKIRVSVTDDKGTTSSAPGCEDKMVTVVSRGHFVADIGVLYQDDPATFLPLRVGYDYRFCDYFSLLGMVGFAPVIHGYDDSNSVMADITGNLHYKRMFFGMGVGYWYSSRNDRVDFILNAGVRLYGEPDQKNVSLFVEGRSAFDEFDEIEDYGRIGGGLRFQF
ncbi:MAG: hypothetical protein AB7S77_07885 [Desulfatirhabdiaceae bacterium]